MNLLQKVGAAIKAAALQDATFQQARVRDWEGAQITLRALYAAIGADMPSMKAPNEANLLCAMVASNLGDAEQALEASRFAIRGLNKPSVLQGAQTRKYLIVYAREILPVCDYYLAEDLAEDLAQAERLSAGMELRKVYKGSLKCFPLNAIVYPDAV